MCKQNLQLPQLALSTQLESLQEMPLLPLF
jgi:hypothetical protein